MCDSLRRQNSVAETKIFAKILQLLASLNVILAVQEAPATVTTALLSAASNLVIALSCGLAKKSHATFSTKKTNFDLPTHAFPRPVVIG